MIFGETFFTLAKNDFGNDFKVNIDKRNWPPILQKCAALSFYLYTVSVIMALFWELDISPYLKDSFTQFIQQSFTKSQHHL